MEGVPLAHDPDVRAIVKVPSRAPYLVDALGVRGQSISVQLTNTSTHSVDVSHFRVAFTAIRDGVQFPCNEHLGDLVKVRPASLAPGQSFAFERDLDCTMALPGRYEVGVYVSVRELADAHGDFVGAFPFDILEGSKAPRPYPAHPGLYVMMTGAPATRPLSVDAWARGDYHVVLSLVNGGNRTVPVGPARLTFLTYRKGSSLPCSGQTEAIALPDTLAPGTVHVIQAPVTCAPTERGQYEIVGRLTLSGTAEQIEVGRVALKVTRNPVLFAPDPEPSFGDRADSWEE
jgi:hypothetical protein